jgi:hypothetical protein
VLIYAPENIGDGLDMRQDVYRVALDEAHAELLDISKRFEELRRRKESLEAAVLALGSMLGMAEAEQVAPLTPEASSNDLPAAAPEAYTFNQVPAPLPDESTTDPFQRRVRNALKFSNNSNNGHEHRGLQPAV